MNVLTKDKPACVNFVHKAEMQEIHMRENLSKVIQAAGHLQGVSLTNIGPGDIYEAQVIISCIPLKPFTRLLTWSWVFCGN